MRILKKQQYPRIEETMFEMCKEREFVSSYRQKIIQEIKTKCLVHPLDGHNTEE